MDSILGLLIISLHKSTVRGSNSWYNTTPVSTWPHLLGLTPLLVTGDITDWWRKLPWYDLPYTPAPLFSICPAYCSISKLPNCKQNKKVRGNFSLACAVISQGNNAWYKKYQCTFCSSIFLYKIVSLPQQSWLHLSDFNKRDFLNISFLNNILC